MCTAHKETITLLNKHAGVTASMTRVASERFCALFAEFFEKFEDSSYNTVYLKRNSTARGRTPHMNSTFGAFMDCTKEEVRFVKKSVSREVSVYSKG